MLKKAYRNFLLFLVSPCKISLVWVPWVMCAIGFCLSIYCYYPGFGGHDPATQYVQAMSGVYGDWHPPMMAALWKSIVIIFRDKLGYDTTGRGVIWGWHTGLVWIGIGAILHSGKSLWSSRHRKGVSRLFVFAIPLLLVGVLYTDLLHATRAITKDTGMLGSYFIATGVLLNWNEKFPWNWIFSCLFLFFLFYGTALRHNAVFAVIPLLLWFVWLLFPKLSFSKLACLSLLLWIGMLGSIHYVNYCLLKTVKLYPLQERFIADIFYLNAFTDKFELPPNGFGRDFHSLSEKQFREQYIPEAVFINHAFKAINESADTPFNFTESYTILSPPLFSCGPNENFYTFPGFGNKIDSPVKMLVRDKDEVNETFPRDYAKLKRAWWSRICSQPIEYLKIKTNLLWKFCKSVRLEFYRINSVIILLLTGWIVVLFSFSKSRMSPDVFPFLMLSWSSILYFVPLWMFLTAEVSRYLYWTLAASVISIVMLCANSELIRSILKLITIYWETRIRASIPDID